MREIGAKEVFRLRACLEALAEHHNQVSIHFKGAYPHRPYEETLNSFSSELACGSSRIAVIEEQDTVIGFCKVDCNGADGKLDYLIVLPSCRGKGCGRQLLDWAMAAFEESGVRAIEVKVVDGNDAFSLYEKYGFRMNAHILLRTRADKP